MKTLFVLSILALMLLSGCEKEQDENIEPIFEWYMVLGAYPAPMYSHPHRVDATFFPRPLQISYFWERKDAFVTQTFTLGEGAGGEWKETICIKPRPGN